MKHVTLIALLLCTSSLGVAQGNQPPLLRKLPASTSQTPGQWVNLFSPPFVNLPTAVESLGCIDGTLCYIPGGSSGTGDLFHMYSFDGKANGSFTEMNMPYLLPVDIMDACGAGGTPSAPHAMSAGMFGANSLENTTTWTPPFAAPVIMTLDIRFEKHVGNHAVLWNGIGEKQSFMVSNDGARSMTSNFVSWNAPLPNQNCQWARMTSIAGNNGTYFQTFGTWPGAQITTARDTLAEKRLLARLHKNGLRVPQRVQPTDSNCQYTAGVGKSVDGGKTWTPVLSAIDAQWYPNEIDCYNETLCVMVAESIYSNTGPESGARIYRTDDGGASWALVLHTPSNPLSSTMRTVKFSLKNPSHVWAGGAKQGKDGNYYAQLLKSVDTGKTWTLIDQIPYIGGVLSLDFTPDGFGYASCITIFDDSTILKLIEE